MRQPAVQRRPSRHMPEGILLFDQYAAMGGGQVIFLSMIEAALRVSDSVSAVFPLAGPLESAIRANFPGAVECVGVEEIHAASGAKSFAEKVRILAHNVAMVRFWRRARRSRLIVANGTRRFPGIMLLSAVTRRPTIYYVQLELDALGKSMLGMAGRPSGSALILCNSAFIQVRLEGSCPSLGGRTAVAECALPKAYSNRPFRDRFGNSRSLEVGIVGLIRPEKGQDAVVAAAARLPGIRFHFIGRVAPDTAAWARRIQSAAGANVTFHGESDDIPSLIDRLGVNVAIMASRCEESFGLAAIEGMALSCIALVRNVGHLPAIAAETGALVFADDEELVGILTRLDAMPRELLGTLAQSQYRRTQARYGYDRLVSDFERHFRDKLAKV